MATTPSRTSGTVTDGSATRSAASTRSRDRLLQGEPGHPAPARRHHPVDQRRHAAPVDHAGRRDHRLSEGRQRQQRARHGRRASRRRADCSADDGCQTFFYTNQQSARLMFYHDHAWGITRLNVYAGEAAGYLITDATEQKLIGRTARSPVSARHPAGHPGQDVRARARRSWPQQDPTWNTAAGAARATCGPPRLHAGAEPRRPVAA